MNDHIDTDVFSKPRPRVPEFNMVEYRKTHQVYETIRVTNPTSVAVFFAVQTGIQRHYSQITRQNFEVPVGAKVVVPPNSTVELPAEFEGAIHQIWCKDQCYPDRTGPCKNPKDHGCVIVASTAPQLIIEDRRQVLHPTFEPTTPEAEIRRVGAPQKKGKGDGR